MVSQLKWQNPNCLLQQKLRPVLVTLAQSARLELTVYIVLHFGDDDPFRAAVVTDIGKRSEHMLPAGKQHIVLEFLNIFFRKVHGDDPRVIADSSDRAALLGAFLGLADMLNSEGGKNLEEVWRRRGRRLFEAEQRTEP